jgi:hypothetical protein
VSEALDGGNIDGAIIDAIVVALRGDGEQCEEKEDGFAGNRAPEKYHAIQPGGWDAANCSFISASLSILLTNSLLYCQFWQLFEQLT